ncbi:hypothetical protein [Lysinibacillus sp. 3P01SB]|uniref:hypothetical protein n=1 Tax=Lysinibacillus sp. 3P01SB TaxID=3132284 RepID=UPI0039A739CD
MDRWIKNQQEAESFAAKDNRTEEENEIARLRKENLRLLMLNDILKQAAQASGRK